jgi:hypothetical protein
MWTFAELANFEEGLDIDDIPPTLRALIPEEDLDAMAEDGELDHGMALHLAYEEVFELPEPGSPEWVMAVIVANSGKFWIAKLCRAMHNHSETYQSILHCGLCTSFVNVRKRKRAANLPPRTLPGCEEIGGAFQLHRPCSNHELTWLRKLIYRFVDKELVEKVREFQPDLRQPRGYDLMSTLYLKEK